MLYKYDYEVKQNVFETKFNKKNINAFISWKLIKMKCYIGSDTGFQDDFWEASSLDF